MFKNMYMIIFGIFATMLVGIISTPHFSEVITYEEGTNMLIPSTVPYTLNGITITPISNNEYMLNGTATVTSYFGFVGNTFKWYAEGTQFALEETNYIEIDNPTNIVLLVEYVSGSVSDNNSKMFINDVGENEPRVTLNTIGGQDTDLKTTNITTYFYCATTTTFNNYTIKIMVEEGTTSSGYSVYGTVATTTIVENDITDYVNSIIRAGGVLTGLIILVTIIAPIITGKKEDE